MDRVRHTAPKELYKALQTYEKIARGYNVSHATLRGAVVVALRTHEYFDTRIREEEGRNSKWVGETMYYRLALRDGSSRALTLALDKFWHEMHENLSYSVGLDDSDIDKILNRLDNLYEGKFETPQMPYRRGTK
jgi:hypothetical protein